MIKIFRTTPPTQLFQSFSLRRELDCCYCVVLVNKYDTVVVNMSLYDVYVEYLCVDFALNNDTVVLFICKIPGQAEGTEKVLLEV